MATGDRSEMAFCIKANLPQHWFGDSSPVLDAIIGGLASTLAFVYSLIQYAKNQTRIGTATDGFLDLISFDYFGRLLPRRQQEPDAPFRTRILAALFPEKGTRNGMIKALVALTGRAPIVTEPTRPLDTGGWSSSISGWSVAGRWGSLQHRAQVFITAFRPSNSGIPNVIGWDQSAGGWSTAGQFKWSTLSQVTGAVTDQDIYSTIDATKAAGTTAWVKISS